MKRLWKTIPPFLADTLGFQSIINNTGGLGVIDDCANYKPLEKMPWRGGMRPGWSKEEKPHRGGRSHGQGGRGKRQPFFDDARIVHSDIHEEDVIHGTEQKMLKAFEDGAAHYNPDFVMLSTSPVSSMIGTDLDSIARQITQRSGLPAASVFLDGQHDYLYGMSLTLEAMGKLLVKPMAAEPNTVNLLGCNSVDWPGQALERVEGWLKGEGFSVKSRWGLRESTENLKQAASASLNLVVNIAGMRLAKWMESEFGTPYLAAAPFGARQCEHIIEVLKNHSALVPSVEMDGEPEALVISEQLEADAVRNSLLASGFKSVRVCSLFEMEKGLMREGDRKLTGEDDLTAQLEQPGLRLIVADPDYRLLTERRVSWIPLPNNASQAPVQKVERPVLACGELDEWIKKAL